MHEIFPREAAANPEPFTGERLTGAVHGQVEIEHYHRYLFARGLCRDRDVLDVASGEGYGTAQLAQVARYVVGLEYAGSTAVNAAMNFARHNIRFIRGDARSLPLSDQSFDVVTSFETLEHFDRQEEFVAEVRRVLRPDGCFVVSTPDRIIYSPPGVPPNPFHVRELDRTEFLDLLHRQFRYVSLLRQRPMLISGLIPEESAAISPLIFQCIDGLTFSSSNALPQAPYLIAIASQLVPRLAPVSLLIERSDIDNVRYGQHEAEHERLRLAEAAARQGEAEARRAEAEARKAEAEARTAEAEARQAVAAARKSEQSEHEAARLAVEAAHRDAQQAEAHSRATTATLNDARSALDQANAELARVSGSARYFIRQYAPRLWRHLFG